MVYELEYTDQSVVDSKTEHRENVAEMRIMLI